MRLELEHTTMTIAPLNTQVAMGPASSGEKDFDKTLADGIAAAQAGNRSRARILLQHAVELESKSEAGWLWLASISEYPEELLVFLNHVLEINPKNTRAAEWKVATNQLMAKTFVQRGIEASKDGRNDLAVRCFDTALTYDEQNQLAWFWKDSLSQVDTGDLAKNNSNDSVSELASKRSIGAILIEAEALLADGDRQEALALVDEAINLEPGSEKAWALKSQLVDDVEAKRNALERLVDINPENATAKAALETLTAIVEPVVHSNDFKTEPAAERILSTPFDQLAQPILADQENSPTQELELPEAIKENNPFVSGENTDQSQEAAAIPFFQQEDWDNYDERVAELENYSPTAADDSFFEESNEVATVPEVQEVSAAAYLEETEESSLPPVDESYLDSPSWTQDDGDPIHQTDEENPVWTIDDSDSIEILDDDAFDTGAKTILVVDDSPVVRKLIAGKLEESGYRVISAGSGTEAIAIISGSIPDLVLLDIAMPKMDGYQVCENIKKDPSTKNIPVVLISGKDGYFDEDRAKKAGTSSFISKPFGPETLMKAMESYLPAAVTAGE